MGDLLKEAIADAKAVRETALANAKMALEEAFTPQLKSMLSAKLKEDEYEEDDDVVAELEPEETHEPGQEEGEEVPAEETEEVPAEEGSYEEDEIPAEEDEEVPTDELAYEEEEAEEGEGDLDLEAVIRELESELTDEDDDDDDDDDEEVAEGVEETDNAYDENAEGKEDSRHVGGTISEGEETEEDDDVDYDDADDEVVCFCDGTVFVGVFVAFLVVCLGAIQND